MQRKSMRVDMLRRLKESLSRGVIAKLQDTDKRIKKLEQK